MQWKDIGSLQKECSRCQMSQKCLSITGLKLLDDPAFSSINMIKIYFLCYLSSDTSIHRVVLCLFPCALLLPSRWWSGESRLVWWPPDNRYGNLVYNPYCTKCYYIQLKEWFVSLSFLLSVLTWQGFTFTLCNLLFETEGK